jgi:hypothetical protein
VPGVSGSRAPGASASGGALSSESAPPAFGGSARADLLGAVAIILITAALAFGPRLQGRIAAHPSASECDALLARYVELKQRSVSEKIDNKSYEASLESARRRAGSSFEECTTQVTLEEAECVRRAGSADEFERCLR